MKILLTGCAGFIGMHLAKKLLARGDEVFGIDNINDYYNVELKYGRLKELEINKNFTFVKCDISDRDTMENIFSNNSFDAVCNLAAQAGVRYSLENPHSYIKSNIDGFLNILEGCRHHKVKNLCYASSSSVYGLNKSQPFNTASSTEHPVSLYAATKKSNELMAHTYSHLYGIQTTGIRFFTVYGPWGRPDMAPMLFSDAILNNRAIKVFNHGNMSRDFTYVEDIVDGVIKIIDNPSSSSKNWNPEKPQTDISSAPYKIYNIGNSQPVKLMDFIKTLEKHLGKEAKKDFLPMQDGDVESTYANVDELIKDFDYKPNTNLDDGVYEFVKWYKDFYNIED